MDIERLNKLGKKAYESLIICTQGAIEEGEPEHVIICGSALVKLAQAEGANYFGNEGPYQYNSAMETGKEAVKFAKKEGVPLWLEDHKNEMIKILGDEGWEFESNPCRWRRKKR